MAGNREWSVRPRTFPGATEAVLLSRFALGLPRRGSAARTRDRGASRRLRATARHSIRGRRRHTRCSRGGRAPRSSAKGPCAASQDRRPWAATFRRARVCEHAFATSQGSAYGRLRRALDAGTLNAVPLLWIGYEGSAFRLGLFVSHPSLSSFRCGLRGRSPKLR